MSELNVKYEVERKDLKCDYKSYSSSETATIITPNIQIYTNIPREDSVNFLLNSYLDLHFEDVKKTDNPDMQTVMIYGLFFQAQLFYSKLLN